MSQSINSNVRASAEEDANKGKNGPLFIALQKNTKTRKHLRLTGSAGRYIEKWKSRNLRSGKHPEKSQSWKKV